MKNILTLITLLIITSCYNSKKTITATIITHDSITEKSSESITKTFSKEERKVFKNKIFVKNIKTVLCHNIKNTESLPIINLNSTEKLLISFDDLDGDVKNYIYTIIHCDSEWKKSDILESEYITGFNTEIINNYEFSFNTIQKYTHYKFTFPNNTIKPLLSGNYIFKIMNENKKEIAYKRFMILDRKVSIESKVRKATLAQYRNTKHEIDFKIKHPNINITNPFSEIKVVVKQNNRSDNAISDLQPIFVRNNELEYDYDDYNTFYANNEFRYFNISSLRYYSEKIKNIEFNGTLNNVYLFEDEKRTLDLYSIKIDKNGKFLINCEEASNINIEADYTNVHFKLALDRINFGEIYLFGEFSEWQLNDDFKLTYNSEEKKYEGSVYLKQGYYNYYYAIKDTIYNQIDIPFIEGTHYQTRNNYFIYVYYRETSKRYDQLIGLLKTSSKELF